MKHRSRYGWAWIIGLLLVTLACNVNLTNTPEPATTEVAQITPGAVTPLPPTADPLTLTPSPTGPTVTPAPVAGEGGCTLQASYVADVTIPDNTEIAPGGSFAKTWRIRNTGTCEWKAGTQLVYSSGEVMGAPATVAVPATAPNAQVDVTVNMVAPTTPNTYKSDWQLQAPNGTRFGGIFYVQIVVPAPMAPPANFAGTVATDCSQATFTWTDAQGEASYRVEGPGLNQTLAAGTTSFTWAPPATGNSTVNLIALKSDGSEIGRVSTSVTVGCVVASSDLIVESITFNRTPVAYLPIHVTVKVRNQGGGAAAGFLLRWWGGKSFATPSCEWNVGGLAAGGTATQECDFIYSSPYGSTAARAEVDSNNSVAEANESNNALEVNTPVNKPALVYDFVEKASVASWRSGSPNGATNLSWPGGENDEKGFARWVTSGNLETGGGIQGKCLEMHPRWVENGWIEGTYADLYNSGYTVQAGDRFRATVGFLQNANAGNVTFKVVLRTGNSNNPTLAQIGDAYGDGFKSIDVDLTPYAGQRAEIVLTVDSAGAATQDWACWLSAAIYRYP